VRRLNYALTLSLSKYEGVTPLEMGYKVLIYNMLAKKT